MMRMFCGKSFRFIFIRNKKKILFCWRSFNKLNAAKTSDPFKKKTVEPFKKSSHEPNKYESDSRNSNRICITIFGNGGIGQPRCVGLFTEFKSYLFNCGEGVGRYCREYGVDTCSIKHVFITQRKWENIGGLSDIYITNQTYGVYRMYLYGPPGVEYFLSMLSSKILDTRILKKEEGYVDHTVNIDYIPITLEKKTFSTYDKKNKMEDEPGVVYSYVCKIIEKPGDFLIEKCIENEVPVGPHLLKLKNWENVVLPCGKIVYAADVHGPSYPERIILIVDCPSELFLESFVNEKKFQYYQIPFHASSSVSIFHFTPSHIFKSEKYQKWMSRFHEGTQHFALNSDNPVLSGTVVRQTEKYFNLLHPKIFRKLRDKELRPVQNSFTDYTTDSKLLHLPPMTQIHFRPKQEFGWCNVVKNHDNVNVTVDGSDIVKLSPEFYSKLEDLKFELQKKPILKVCNDVYPEVVFLGTGSATSTAYRNVSAILVNTSADKSILLDCGEGTMMQFVRYFGSDVYSVLQKISCIFISHKHLDHYMGVFEIISQRKKAFQHSGMPYKPLAVILPSQIQNILMKFSETFQNLRPAVRFFNSKYLAKKKNFMEQFIGDLELTTVSVKHCNDAWGIVIESGSQWKVVYSGDTAPCQALIDAGKDCTLLIHEASIEDEMDNEASAKSHCTPSQAIDIAERMNAQYTILTHFSKRYQGFPVLPECSIRKIVCAFDFMKVQKCDLPLLSLFTPVIKCLFKGRLEDNVEKTSMVVNFENVFLKALRS